jgi:AbrB family looped-hinge helix DNA binding protein
MRKVGTGYLAKVTTVNRITVPVEFRRKLGLQPGDKVVLIEDGHGYRIEAKRKRTAIAK